MNYDDDNPQTNPATPPVGRISDSASADYLQLSTPLQLPDDVPPGYKKTEVGVIPEDWEFSQLMQITDILTGFPFPSAGFSDTGIRLLRGSNVKRSVLDWDIDITKYWPKLTADILKYQLENGDVIIAMDGALVGRSYASICESDLPCLLLQRVVRLRSSSHSQKLIFHWITSISFHEYVDAVKTHTAIPHISPADIRNFLIAFPKNLEEQHAIATALSDVDGLMAALDQLIAKKRAIRQAAMQQLLTGRTRLPGFSGEWKVKRLGEILDVGYGRDQKNIVIDSGRYPILGTGGEIGRTNTPLYDKPSMLIGRKGTIDEPRYIETPFWTVDTLFYTKMHQSTSAKFIYYKACMIPWKTYNEASGVPSLSSKTIENIEIELPTIKEQTAIATVLSDMDAEIEALERRRDKARELKTGMMQQLLTGRIRLVKPEAA